MTRYYDRTYQSKQSNAINYNDLPLFASPDICKNKHQGNANSKTAYSKAKKSIINRKQKILELLSEHKNLTLQQLTQFLNCEKNAISGRLSELKRDGLIKVVATSTDGFAVYEVA